jgi:AcrR family transcriptional regulator
LFWTAALTYGKLVRMTEGTEQGRQARGAPPRSASRGARERARAELTREIKQEARRQLAAHGAQNLSLRGVARELGMASSALYRYFPSRDDLLTSLIIDAYDSLGQAAEDAEAGSARGGRTRWRATCAAVRNWALAHPHEYALIYGSPVPGYRAPEATVGPATRVARVIGRVLADTAVKDNSACKPGSRNSVPPILAEQAAVVADLIAPGTPATVIARVLIAWTQVFGMISFELFGQLVGSADPADAFFGYALEQMGDFIGLPQDPAGRP